MKISIIVPVYNVEEYITECLTSIKSLDIDYEIIVVNDGSKDSSLERINEFAKTFNGDIKIISKENGGLSSARNVGIQNALGDYLFFLDSDDYIDKNMFELFAKNVILDGVDLGFADCRFLTNGRIESNHYTEYRKKIALNSNPIVNGIQYGEHFFDKKHNFLNVEACFQLIRKNLLIDNNISFLPGLYHEDTLFTITCLISAARVRYYDYPFYFYRMRENSIMHTLNPLVIKKKYEDKQAIALELFKLKDEANISAQFVDTIIVDLLLVSLMHFKRKSLESKKIMARCKNITIKSRIRVVLFKVFSFNYD